MTTTANRTPSAEALREWETAYLRVKTSASARLLWQRKLSEEDRQRLGGDWESAYAEHGTVGMWMELQDTSFERAVVDVAHGIGLLDVSTHEWLVREMGEEVETRTPSQPRWDRETGLLRLGQRVIREVRVFEEPTKLQQVLDAFEDAEWVSRIDNPLRSGQQETHQVVLRLNEKLDGIRFRVQEGAWAITWTRS